jgi:hypothetical protein
MDLTFLDRLNWLEHDGINLPMINDVSRNQFYDKILAKTVLDCNCIDIGFGTGLLSMLALKHGARHILAFESDPDRYQLGQLVIEKLNLTDRIQLLNERYDGKMFNNFLNVDVLFTETMTTNLWGEGLLLNLPRQKGIKFLPTNISVNIYACTVSDRFTKLVQFTGSDVDGFDPGVDVDLEFVNLINQLGFPAYVPPPQPINQNLIFFNCYEKKQWGWMSHLKLLSIDSKLVAGYTLNTEEMSITLNDSTGVSVNNINFDATYQNLTINMEEWSGQNVLLVPRVELSCNNKTLILDNSGWGPVAPVIIANSQQSNILFSHNLLTGSVNYYE